MQRFESEAATHGRFFDFKGNGLIIEFAHLPDNIAGLTHYEDPIRIEIDKTYWDNIGKSAGADLMKEDLMFHELGHGLLNRKHLNTILSNGDWKSIMCGGGKVNNRTWNINYHGFRKKYYDNELFNEHAELPDSLGVDLLIDTTGYKPVFHLSFETSAKNDTGWSIGDSLNYNSSIVQGRLRYQSKLKQRVSFLLKTDVDFQQDFSLQLRIEYLSENSEDQYGLVFGSIADKSSSGTVHSLEYFTINNNQWMFVGNSSWFSYFTELSRPEIVSKLINVLKVIKKGHMLYYFINNKYMYCNELEATGLLNYVGFVVPPLGLVYLDDLLVSQKNGMPISEPINQKQRMEIQFINTKLLYREISTDR